MAKRAIGKAVFNKVALYLQDTKLKGELPEDVNATTTLTPEELKNAADDFIRKLHPVLISDGLIHPH